MNEPPILLRIASHCDMKTLLNFMTVNKKCYSVFKYIVRNAPTVFIAMYFTDTNGTLPNKVIYKSLKELFTELHQYYLNNPVIENYNGKRIKNYGKIAGPCYLCLKASEFDYCTCDEIEYKGINMIKYISNESKEEKESIIKEYNFKHSRSTTLEPLSDRAKGFRISMVLNNYTWDRPKCNNYKSMEYLYFGQQEFPFLLKNGIRERCPDKMKYCPMYYPATTDMLSFLEFLYLPNGKADFKEYHGIDIIEDPISKLRVNTI